mmetsp:Transcript_35122/g.74155  ORF Transcript_35122/g.74155 Transcript_35122/m.74155 type:complete len:1054 (+) Transcript_35122:488-3649(+)
MNSHQPGRDSQHEATSPSDSVESRPPASSLPSGLETVDAHDAPVPIAQTAAVAIGEAEDEMKKKAVEGSEAETSGPETVDADDAPVPIAQTSTVATIEAQDQMKNELIKIPKSEEIMPPAPPRFDADSPDNEKKLGSVAEDDGPTTPTQNFDQTATSQKVSHYPTSSSLPDHSGTPANTTLSAVNASPSATLPSQTSVILPTRPPPRSMLIDHNASSEILTADVSSSPSPADNYDEQNTYQAVAELVPDVPLQQGVLVAPWWKRNKAIIAIVLMLLVALAAALGALFGPSNDDGNANGKSIIDVDGDLENATSKPSLSPDAPPLTTASPSISPISCGEAVKTVFEIDCDDCKPAIAMDRDVAVVARKNSELQFFFRSGQIYQPTMTIGIDFEPTTIAISSNTTIVGAGKENFNTGAVYLYERNMEGNWSHTVKIVPKDIGQRALFGLSVSIDENVFVVGAEDDGEDGHGSAYIYRRNESAWFQEAKLAPTHLDAKEFGWSTDIRGGRVVISDPYHYFVRLESVLPGGGVYVYDYDKQSKTWERLDHGLHGALESYGCDSLFGNGMALMQDVRLFVGCSGEQDNAGAIYYFQAQSLGSDYTLEEIVTGSDRTWGDNFGGFSKIAVDNGIMAAGTDTGALGKVHVFTQSNSKWTEVARLEGSDSFGRRVAISGNTALVASNTNAYFYSLESSILEECFDTDRCSHSKFSKRLLAADCTRCFPMIAADSDTTVVTRQFQDIQFISSEGRSTVPVDYFPSAVHIHGNRAIVGSATENNFTGAVHVYEKNQAGNWIQTLHTAPADVGHNERFGSTVSINRDLFLVGTRGIDKEDQGSAYIYRHNGTMWLNEAKIMHPNIQDWAYSTSVKGNTVVIGDANYNDDTGAAFVHEYDSESKTWKQLNGAITNDDCDSLFGDALALTDDGGLFIGCPGKDNFAGAIYYYIKSEAGNYSLQQKITGSSREAGEKMGEIEKIKVDGNFMIAGTYKEVGGTSYVFTKSNGIWTELTQLDNPAAGTYFGRRVALAGNTAIVAADRNVYSYKLDVCRDGCEGECNEDE